MLCDVSSWIISFLDYLWDFIIDSAYLNYLANVFFSTVQIILAKIWLIAKIVQVESFSRNEQHFIIKAMNGLVQFGILPIQRSVCFVRKLKIIHKNIFQVRLCFKFKFNSTCRRWFSGISLFLNALFQRVSQNSFRSHQLSY